MYGHTLLGCDTLLCSIVGGCFLGASLASAVRVVASCVFVFLRGRRPARVPARPPSAARTPVRPLFLLLGSHSVYMQSIVLRTRSQIPALAFNGNALLLYDCSAGMRDTIYV